MSFPPSADFQWTGPGTVAGLWSLFAPEPSDLPPSTTKTDAIDLDAAEQAIGVRPETALKLMNLAAQEDVPVKEIADTIDADPSMAAKTLKLANSSYFGMANKVSRIDRAVTMLGGAQIAKLAASSSVESAFKNVKISAPGISPATPWNFSLAVALTADFVANQCKTSSAVGTRRLSAEAFVAGLIHDIGMLAQAALNGDAFGQAVTASIKTGLPLIMQERRLIGYDHARVGLLLAERWSLPVTLVQGVGFHHEPLAAEPAHRDVPCVIYIAEYLVRQANVPSLDGDADAQYLTAALEFVRIDPTRLDKLAATARRRLADPTGA